MSTFTDAYGATVTGDPATGWTRGGMTLGPCSQPQALTVFNGASPDGWVPPVVPPVVPIMVTNLQFRSALIATPSATPGKSLFDLANATIVISDGLAYQAWQYGNNAYRSSALVDLIMARLSLSASTMDALFTLAATYTQNI